MVLALGGASVALWSAMPPAQALSVRICPTTWAADVAYPGGAVVAQDQRAYRARWWTLGEPPARYAGTGWSVWVDDGPCWGPSATSPWTMPPVPDPTPTPTPTAIP
ncbi:hypothetical protein Slu03_22760 [Sediminihabitans luteus]|nr:hypothetical protein Slu03_22760 [Sediminihabitans luteus]